MKTEQRRTKIKMESRKCIKVLSKELVRDQLEKMFSADNTLISRHDPLLNGIVAAGTLANADSEGTGIEERVIIGNKTFYVRSSAINWLVARAK